MTTPRTAEALNAAATAAAETVYAFAARFADRATYGPLEALAQDVQRAVLDAAMDVFRRRDD